MFASMLRAKTRFERAENFSSSFDSCANDLTTWTPTMFSSATVVMSAIFCWTSRRTGCETCEYRYASRISTGVIAQATSASFQLTTSITVITATTVSTCWKKKMRP